MVQGGIILFCSTVATKNEELNVTFSLIFSESLYFIAKDVAIKLLLSED